MFHYIYSKKYGFTPFWFLLKGRDFYKERKKWLHIHSERNLGAIIIFN